ncbi:MAG: hypothetical protein JSS76_19855 [Bacteroidetes bacterium]|nr:hypothetical protein [Bacteroidota bacterium]MBS1687003.1 hypothetical protein [Bacteroidota bacterium]
MDIIVLAIFSYALYRLAMSHHIRPWRWIINYVLTFMVSTFAMAVVLLNVYGQNMMKDMDFMAKVAIRIEPFILLYQFVLFFFFRTRILKYVHALDELDKIDNTPPTPPAPKKEDKDLSYFR